MSDTILNPALDDSVQAGAVEASPVHFDASQPRPTQTSPAQATPDGRNAAPPAVAVSTVAFALHPPVGARIGSLEVDEAGAPLRSEPAASADRSAPPPASDSASYLGGTDSGVTLWLPLVRRTRAPFAGQWALPGGPIPPDETLVDTALRTLRAAVHCEPNHLEQLYSFGAVERSADAQRLVTIAYWALYGEQDLCTDASESGTDRTISHSTAAEAANDSAAEAANSPAAEAAHDPNVAWFSADRLPALAFDHADIVAYAVDRLRSKTEYSTIAYRFLGQQFTLAQLRAVHEAILGEPVDQANFRRQALSQGYLIDTGELTRGASHRPARLYRFREATAQEQRNIA